jgi:hypothetical protein
MSTSSNNPQVKKKYIDSDELIGVIVAFGTIGSILFWSLSNKNNETTFQNLDNLFSTSEGTTTRDVNGVTANKGDSIATSVPISEKLPSTANLPLIGTKNSSDTARKSLSEEKTKIIAWDLESLEDKPVENTTSFKDLSKEHWAFPFIQKLKQENLLFVTDKENFMPDRPVTRGELAKQIEQAFSKNPTLKSIKFKDVDAKDAISGAIDKAVKIGFMKGYPGERFEPTKNLSRLEMLVSLVSGLNLKPSKNVEETLKVYTDSAKIPQWAKEKIAAATEAGLVVNYPDPRVLNPTEKATRTDLATAFYQGLIKAGKVQSIASPYIVSMP